MSRPVSIISGYLRLGAAGDPILPITVVVFNNQKLGLITMEQESQGFPDYQTSLHNPDFAEFALGYAVAKAKEVLGRGDAEGGFDPLLDPLRALHLDQNRRRHSRRR